MKRRFKNYLIELVLILFMIVVYYQHEQWVYSSDLWAAPGVRLIVWAEFLANFVLAGLVLAYVCYTYAISRNDRLVGAVNIGIGLVLALYPPIRLTAASWPSALGNVMLERPFTTPRALPYLGAFIAITGVISLLVKQGGTDQTRT